VRRRPLLRGHGALLAALLALVLGAAGAAAAPAQAAPATSSSSTVAAAQKALGITADGVAGPQTRRAVRRFQRARRLRVTGRLDRRTLRALGVRPSAGPASTPAAAPAGADAALLERIARCESGGDPAAVSADGRYRGKYQFSRSTWEALGGTGDPAAAPEAVQDAMAAKLLAQRGTSPWPHCGA
jgi:peptidoglycan hydrolase-like protein with peptidoglycan-binding domain